MDDSELPRAEARVEAPSILKTGHTLVETSLRGRERLEENGEVENLHLADRPIGKRPGVGAKLKTETDGRGDEKRRDRGRADDRGHAAQIRGGAMRTSRRCPAHDKSGKRHNNGVTHALKRNPTEPTSTSIED